MTLFIKTFTLFLFIFCVSLSHATDLKSKLPRAVCKLDYYGALFFREEGNKTLGTLDLTIGFFLRDELLGGKYAESDVKLDLIEGSPEMYQDPHCTISENVTTVATLNYFYKYANFYPYKWQTTTSLDDMIGKGKLRTI